jgi:hypothetical protein
MILDWRRRAHHVSKARDQAASRLFSSRAAMVTPCRRAPSAVFLRPFYSCSMYAQYCCICVLQTEEQRFGLKFPPLCASRTMGGGESCLVNCDARRSKASERYRCYCSPSTTTSGSLLGPRACRRSGAVLSWHRQT